MRGLHLEEKLTLKVKDVDVIVLDYMLPDINGVETLKEIRKINRKIPISLALHHCNTDIYIKRGDLYEQMNKYEEAIK